MIGCNHITKIVGMVMAAAVLVCFLAMAAPEKLAEALGSAVVEMRYQTELFGTDESMKIDIRMEADAWEEMLDNASAEEYYDCDVEINGQVLYYVGIRPKGNTSLSAIVSDPDTDRFSLKLEFDHYVEGQTCLGLDKLILNNNYADATNRKEAIIYDMFQYLGADASLYNYAEISVNGEYWGVYLALEAVEDSFLLRNYGTEDGELYKPEGMEMGGSFAVGDFRASDREKDEAVDWTQGGGFPMPDGANHEMPGAGELPAMGGMNQGAPEEGVPEVGSQPTAGEGGLPMPGAMIPPWAEGQEGTVTGSEGQDGFGLSHRSGSAPPDMGGQRGGGGFSMGGSGADLNYTDDDLDSYSTIWEGEVTDTGESDHRRVVDALKNISQGTELEDCLDIDNVLRYMAVHVFSVNMDSLSGNMAHNYYLYESNGKLNILPWDYNLSFGGMGMGSVSGASEMINDAIDDPFQGTRFFDALLEDETYRARYHEYLRQLVEGYVYGGRLQETYSRIRQQIDPLVETDPTAFYSYEEYETAVEMLYRTLMLRAESIRGQLDGTIPSTEAGQRADSSGLIDASAIDVSAMGMFQMGGKSFHFNGVDVRFSDWSQETESGDSGKDSAAEADAAETETVDLQQMRPDGKGEASEKAEEPGRNERGQDVPAMAERDMGAPGAPDTQGAPGAPDAQGAPGAPGAQGAPGVQGAPNVPGAPGTLDGAEGFNNAQNIITCAACLLLMAIALAAAKNYRRIPKKSLNMTGSAR